MQPVSAGQIKAARALLDWSQEDLAQAACLSVSTVRTMELGKIPRVGTLRGICQTFQNNGLEFTEGEGVRRRDFGVSTLKGANIQAQKKASISRHPRAGRGSHFLFSSAREIQKHFSADR